MNFNSVIMGFVTGVACSIAFVLGRWMIFLPKVSKLVQKDNLYDLSHYGRKAIRVRRKLF